jgi:hypothetical protein
MSPTLLPPPDHDPDGAQLMASLRARIGGASSIDRRTADYRPVLAAIAELVARRRDFASSAERGRLENLQRDLQALARGL